MRRTLTGALVCALTLLTAVAGMPASSAATGRVLTIGPGADVGRTLSSLRAGDMLRLQPGTYNITGTGMGIHPTLAAGTAARPIVVTALDGAHPPLLKGALFLDKATHWTLQYLRFQGNLVNRTEVYIAGGVGWTVRKSEFFGASATGSFANVAISNTSTSGLPQHWQFVDNCVHDGGNGQASGHSPDTDHNLYISASGMAPGLVARNVMFNATAGYNIKVGVGDGSTAGASNVHILYNTLYNARRQVLILGKLTGDVVARNILAHSTRPSLPSAAVFYGMTYRGSAAIAHNYVYQADPGWYAYPAAGTRFVSDGGDNLLHRADPGLSAGCGMTASTPTVASSYGTRANGASTPVVP